MAIGDEGLDRPATVGDHRCRVRRREPDMADTLPSLVHAVDAAEKQRGFAPPTFVDIRFRSDENRLAVSGAIRAVKGGRADEERETNVMQTPDGPKCFLSSDLRFDSR
jgi:hypothetical protein